MTWANQIRILKQQFEALGAIIGQNFIYALKPVVTALNTVMAKLIQFARVVSNSLGKIFGWKYEDTTGGIAEDLEFGADAAEDLGGGLGGAADKAKKLKQQLQGFDELNVLTTNEPSSGGGGGGGGALSDEIATGNTGQWVKDSGLFDFESDLDSLYKLGDYIGTTLTNQLRSIDWNKVYEGARNFGSGLASFLNGLISPELFSATGATIAGALNVAIYSTLAFGTEFDFEELGLSIAESINTFFRDTDFSALADDINTWVQGIWTTITTAVSNIDWVEIFSAFYDYITGLDVDTVIKLLGIKVLAGLIKGGLFSSIASVLTGKAFIDKIMSILASGGTPALTSGLSNTLTSLSNAIFNKFTIALATAFIGFNIGNWLYEHFDEEIDAFVESVGNKLGLGGGTTPATDWETYYNQGINKFNNPEQAQNYADYSMQYREQGWNERQAPNMAEERINIELHNAGAIGWEDYTLNVENATNANKRYTVSQNKAEKATTKSGKSVDAFSKFSHSYTVNLDKVSEKSDVVATSQALFGATMLGVFGELSDGSSAMSSDVTQDFSNMATTSGYRMNSMKSNVLGNMVAMNNSVTTNAATMSKNAIGQFTSMFNSGTNQTTNLKNNATNLITTMASNISTKLGAMNTDGSSKFSLFKTTGENNVGAMATSISGKLSNVNTDSNTKLTSLVSTIANKTSEMLGASNTNFGKFEDGASKGLINMQATVGSRMASVTGVITGQDWNTPGVNLVNGLRNGITNQWNASLKSKLVSLAQSLTSALKNAFGIHSPSRIWQEDIGFYLAEGLRLGVVNEEGHITRDIIGMGNRLTDSFGGALTLATPSSLSSGYNFGVTSTMTHSFSADTSMTSNIADGVRQGLANSQAEQNALLREQNELLMQILEKTGISSSDLFNAVRRESRQHYNQTGTSAFVY